MRGIALFGMRRGSDMKNLYIYKAIVYLYLLYYKFIPSLFRKNKSKRIEESRTAFYRNIWKEAADAVGASINELGKDIFEISKDGRRVRVHKNYSSLDDPVTLKIAGDKPLVYKILTKNEIPTPGHLVFRKDEIGAAFLFMEDAGTDCVVKPANATGGGTGVTTGVRRKYHLAKAVAYATAIKNEIMIEEQIPGENYRLLYVDGILIDAVLRKGPVVVGDGRSSIKKLVQDENNERLKGGVTISKRLIKIDCEMRNTLNRTGRSLRSVPKPGQVVFVKNVINENRGEDNEAASHLLCQSIIDDGAQAALLIGARLAGVDVITSDPHVSLKMAGGAIIDINTTPGFLCHYMREGIRAPVAIFVLKRVFGLT